MNKQANYKIILDTNILYELTKRYSGNVDRKVLQIEGILKCHRYNIIVPDLVWAEFSAAFFQKGFPYDDYAKWHENRFIAFAQVYRTINLEAQAEYLRTASLNSFNSVDYLELAREIAAIKFSEGYIKNENERMQKKIREAQNQTQPKTDLEEKRRCKFIERQENQLRKGKLLDGMDAQIFSAGILYAMQNSECSIYILTMDMFFKSAASHICWHISLYKEICSLLSITKNNDLQVLEEKPQPSISNLKIVSIWEAEQAISSIAQK